MARIVAEPGGDSSPRAIADGLTRDGIATAQPTTLGTPATSGKFSTAAVMPPVGRCLNSVRPERSGFVGLLVQ
jgi:hypothetical protein